MSNIFDFQEKFQRGVLTGDISVLDKFANGPRETREFMFTTNAVSIWIEVKNHRERPEPVRLQTIEHVLVWRAGDDAIFRVLSTDEAQMWDHAANGATFAKLCQTLTAQGSDAEPSARAATYLASWIDSGLLSSASAEH